MTVITLTLTLEERSNWDQKTSPQLEPSSLRLLSLSKNLFHLSWNPLSSISYLTLLSLNLSRFALGPGGSLQKAYWILPGVPNRISPHTW